MEVESERDRLGGDAVADEVDCSTGVARCDRRRLWLLDAIFGCLSFSYECGV